MTLVDQLFLYNFPCYLTSYFQQWKNKYEFHLQFEILKTMSTFSFQKQLYIQEFLGLFNLSNFIRKIKKQTEIKLLIIQSLQELVDKRIIKSFFKTIQKDGSLILETNLPSKLITKSKVIY